MSFSLVWHASTRLLVDKAKKLNRCVCQLRFYDIVQSGQALGDFWCKAPGIIGKLNRMFFIKSGGGSPIATSSRFTSYATPLHGV